MDVHRDDEAWIDTIRLHKEPFTVWRLVQALARCEPDDWIVEVRDSAGLVSEIAEIEIDHRLQKVRLVHY